MNQCDLVRDLLPLYVDGVCSQTSAELIAKHTAQCKQCAKRLAQLKDHSVEAALQTERNSVIARHAQATKRKTFQVGAIISAILIVPVLVCLIVNLVTGHALDWFFIVLTSLMVFASLTVIPLMAERKKLVWTLGTFTVSLFLLFLTCCVYTGGDWFFVASSSVLFGLSAVSLPFALRELPLGWFWNHNKGLLILGVDTLLFALMMICIGIFTGTADYWKTVLSIAPYVLAMVWASFLWFRYVKLNGYFKAGVFTAVLGAYLFSADPLLNHWLGYDTDWPVMHLTQWNAQAIDGNISWLILLVCGVVGLLLVVMGVVRAIKSR